MPSFDLYWAEDKCFAVKCRGVDVPIASVERGGRILRTLVCVLYSGRKRGGQTGLWRSREVQVFLRCSCSLANLGKFLWANKCLHPIEHSSMQTFIPMLALSGFSPSRNYHIHFGQQQFGFPQSSKRAWSLLSSDRCLSLAICFKNLALVM